MQKTLYAMITTRSSRHYTELAIDSFRKNTKLVEGDEFILVDNDAELDYGTGNVFVNHYPKSFAQNTNSMLDYANGRNLMLLSNDVAFTPGWNESVVQMSNALIIPSCNQTHLYSRNDLHLKEVMHLSDYSNRHIELNQISNEHISKRYGFFERLLMSFYVFFLPANVYRTLGKLDESFGTAGGEDIDYRLRAIEAGVPVKYIGSSYLLHFAGKSSWDGPEQSAITQQRNHRYFSEFSQKWGDDLANLCLVGGNPHPVIEKYNLTSFIENQDYSGAIKVVLNRTDRN